MKRDTISLDNISAVGLLRELCRNWWVIVCIALAVLLGATGVGQLTYQAEYTASSTLVVRVQDGNMYTSLSTATQMAAVYSEVFQSNALRNIISERIGEPVVGSISCQQIPETNLLTLSATSPTPRQAYLFIHSALNYYEEVAGYVFDNADLELVQEPTVPETPSNRSPLIAHRVELTFLGAAAAAGMIFLLYVMRNTVKVSAKAGDLLDGNVLGTIPHEKGRKKRKKTPGSALLLTSPLTSAAYTERMRQVASQVENSIRRKQQKIVLVASVMENEGKSTVTANLAIALAERGNRLLLIDGDLRKPAQWKIFDRKPEQNRSLSDVLTGRCAWDQAITLNQRGRFWQLMQFRAVSDPGRLLNSQALPALLTTLAQEMDIILVDCCPVAAVADAELWMHLVDTVIMVVRQDVADVRIINDTVDLIWKSKANFSGFILNDFQEKAFSSHYEGYYGNH